MRKFKLIIFCVIIAIGCSATSCSSITYPSPEEVMSKINTGEALDEADYETMVDYINDFCDEADYSDGSYEAGREAGERYPYFLTFTMTLANAVDNIPDKVGDKQEATAAVKRMMKVMGR
ncbi:MAG: hypothetical protein HDS84_01825 [Bacteroidales bacterium]|nr:hypothetical protein [Bacteroidales bacterium]